MERNVGQGCVCGEREGKIRKNKDLQDRKAALSSFLGRWLQPKPHQGLQVPISGDEEVSGRKWCFCQHGKRAHQLVGFFFFLNLPNVADEGKEFDNPFLDGKTASANAKSPKTPSVDVQRS